MAAIQGVLGDIWLTASPSVQQTSVEAMNDSGDHINYNAATHKYWDFSHVIVFEQSANGSTGWTTINNTGSDAYYFNYCGGLLVFTVARTPGVNNFIRIQANAGWYLTATQLTDMHEWNLDLGGDTVDTTSFQAPSNFRVHTATLKKATAKCNGYRTDGTLLADLNNLQILVLYANRSANVRWEMYAWCTAVVPKVTVAGVVTQEASFAIQGQVYYYTS